MQEVHEAADARQGAAQQMGQELGAPDVDAQHIGRSHVAAHGVEAAAQFAPAQQDEQGDDDDDCHDDARLHIGGNVLAQLVDAAHAGNIDTGGFQGLEGLMLHVKLGGIDDGGHAFGEEHTGKGHDEGLDFQIGNQIALHQAKGHANAQRNEHGGQNTAVVVVQMDSAAHAHQCGQRTHGNVDTAGDHHDGHAAGQDDQRRVVIEDVEKCLGLAEARAQQGDGAGVHHHKHHHGDGQQQVGIGHVADGQASVLCLRCHIRPPPLLLPCRGRAASTALRFSRGQQARS